MSDLDDITKSMIPSLLTPKQRTELHQAMIDYLIASGYSNAAEVLKKDLGVQQDAKAKGMLEKKWASIVRMQKKVMELEAENKLLKERESDRARPDFSKDTLPRGPAKLAMKGHRDDITAVKFHPEFDVIVSASEDASMKVWDMEQGQVERTLKGHTGAVRDVVFSPKGDLLASCSNDLTIKLWDFKSFNCIKTLPGHDHTISCVRFMPSGDFVVSSSRDKTIKVWETSTGHCKHTLQGHDKWVRKIDISPNGALIASASSDHTVRIWETRTWKCIQVYREHENVVEHVAFGNAESDKVLYRMTQSVENGSEPAHVPVTQPTYVATCGRDKLIKVFEASTGVTVLTLADHDNWVRQVMFHPDGRHLISISDDRSIKLWSLKDQRCIRTIADAHDGFVQTMDFNARNPHLVTGGVDHAVLLWGCRYARTLAAPPACHVPAGSSTMNTSTTRRMHPTKQYDAPYPLRPKLAKTPAAYSQAMARSKGDHAMDDRPNNGAGFSRGEAEMFLSPYSQSQTQIEDSQASQITRTNPIIGNPVVTQSLRNLKANTGARPVLAMTVRQILQGIIRRPNGDVALRNNPRVSVTFVEIVASLVKISQQPSKQSPVVKFYIGDSSTPETLPAEYWTSEAMINDPNIRLYRFIGTMECPDEHAIVMKVVKLQPIQPTPEWEAELNFAEALTKYTESINHTETEQ